MREDMFMMDTTSREAKNQLKLFIKHRVGVRGDKVFWGKLLRERGQGERQRGGGQESDGGGEPEILEENQVPMDEGLNSPRGRGLGDRTQQDRGLENTTQREGETEDRTSPRVGGDEQRYLPLTQQGLSTNTESSKAGPLSKPGKHQWRDDKQMEKDGDILQWEAVFDILLSHAHPAGLQRWLEGAGHGERLYL